MLHSLNDQIRSDGISDDLYHYLNIRGLPQKLTVNEIRDEVDLLVENNSGRLQLLNLSSLVTSDV